MIINILAVGNVKENYYRDKIGEYVAEIKKKIDIRLITVKDCPIPKGAGERINDKIKQQEGQDILSHIGGRDYVVALCIEGKALNEGDFSSFVRLAEDKMCSTLTFVIGGSLGLHENVIKRADFKLSFSPMTFPHQLMRVMLLERMKAAICDR